ncbi:hypothetical protein QUA08_16670 [Microcoleus sp. T3B2]|uniref:hypothetical protein n=1 Tax=Microcoleus sp. T3B2 TaxID=3055426 RepID=UPI002FD27236
MRKSYSSGWTRLDGVRFVGVSRGVAIALTDITYALGMKARTSRLPCSERRSAGGAKCQGFWSWRRLRQVTDSDNG